MALRQATARALEVQEALVRMVQACKTPLVNSEEPTSSREATATILRSTEVSLVALAAPTHHLNSLELNKAVCPQAPKPVWVFRELLSRVILLLAVQVPSPPVDLLVCKTEGTGTTPPRVQPPLDRSRQVPMALLDLSRPSSSQPSRALEDLRVSTTSRVPRPCSNSSSPRLSLTTSSTPCTDSRVARLELNSLTRRAMEATLTEVLEATGGSKGGGR